MSGVRQRAGLRPTRADVDLAAIRANVARLRRLGGVGLCVVVKADGYGHGAVAVSRAALDAGATWLGVALVEEGIALRDARIDAPILLLSEPPVAAVEELLAAQLTPTVYRASFVAALDAAGRRHGVPIPVHLKADTGMARVGVPRAQWREVLQRVADGIGIEVQGIQTHLARADEPSEPTTDEQLRAFDEFLGLAAQLGIRPPLVHAANTAGLLLHPASRHTLARPGIGVYGLSPASDVDAASHGLVPALRVVSEVSFAKRIAADTPVSYGHRWSAPRDGWLATVPVGYADGLPRRLGGQVDVLVGGRRCPLAGTVTMDQVLVWCDQDEPHVGDEVVLIGEQGGERIRIEEWAAAAGTITYEIVTQLTARIPRRFHDTPPAEEEL